MVLAQNALGSDTDRDSPRHPKNVSSAIASEPTATVPYIIERRLRIWALVLVALVTSPRSRNTLFMNRSRRKYARSRSHTRPSGRDSTGIPSASARSASSAEPSRIDDVK